VLTSSSFDFPAQLPANVRYVGPILDDPAWAAEQRWAPPAGDEALVLLAMSSTFQDQVGVLQRCVDALGSLPVRGVATTGQVVAPADIRSVPNVAVFASAPHSVVLEHASVVVTHGGHGTVMRTLAAGVPMVVLPQGRDQADNAVRVASRGAGVTLKSTAAAGEIADAIQSVLADPRYRQAAERLGACIRKDVASSVLVAELEDLPS
jgi:MGT family glycosyltransferase